MVKRFLIIFFSYFALIALATLGGMYLASKHVIGIGLVAVIIIVVTVIPLLFMNKIIFGTSGKEKKILASGVEALAEILDVGETGVTINEIYFNIKLTLKVKPDNSPPFEVKTTHLFSRLQVPRVGDILRVKYDPLNLTEVVIITNGNAGYDQKAIESRAMEMLKKLDEENKMILSYGVEAKAKIINAEDLNIKVNGDNPLMSFELEIMPEGKPKFFARAKAPILHSSIDKYEKGDIITVKYDPNDLTKVSLFHS